MATIKRMLVPIDFSPTSDIALNYALDLAGREHSTMHLLHVVDDGTLTSAYADGIYVEIHGLRARMIDENTSRLQVLARQCADAGVNVSVEVVVGRPARAIVERATTLGSDLVVMGTHGRSGVAHLVLGSVAERVVRTAPCPVLAVRDTARVADMLAQEASASGDGALQPA